MSEPTRCWTSSDPLYNAYHDEEWGRPVTDERGLLERFCLEGFQSGLSWLTILRKRENFRAAFADFEPERVARFGKRDVERLVKDAGIVRHRGKIEAAIANARGTLALREAGTSLEEVVWAHRAKVLPLPEDRQPGQPGLKAFEAEPFEQSSFVGDGPAPFLIVVRVVQRVARRPATRRFRQA